VLCQDFQSVPPDAVHGHLAIDVGGRVESDPFDLTSVLQFGKVPRVAQARIGAPGTHDAMAVKGNLAVHDDGGTVGAGDEAAAPACVSHAR
jgi:hypothetical protein